MILFQIGAALSSEDGSARNPGLGQNQSGQLIKIRMVAVFGRLVKRHGGFWVPIEEGLPDFGADFKRLGSDGRPQPGQDIWGCKGLQRGFENPPAKAFPSGVGSRNGRSVPGRKENRQAVRRHHDASYPWRSCVAGIGIGAPGGVSLDASYAVNLIKPGGRLRESEVMGEALAVLFHARGIIADVGAKIDAPEWTPFLYRPPKRTGRPDSFRGRPVGGDERDGHASLP